MKYFMTGATGFIGFHLAKRLTEAGHTVHALYRDESKTGDLKRLEHLHLFQGDLFDQQRLADAMKGCDGIFHLAAHAKPWDKDPGNFHRINVEGTANVFETALRSGIKRIVFTSTAGVISPSNGKPSDENTKRTVELFTDYERSKLEAEAIVAKFSAKKLEIITVNPTRVYGPGLLNESNSVTKAIKLFIKGELRYLPGNGKNTSNYVYVDDVVQGHLLAMEKGRPGERYILGGENLSYRDFFDLVADLLGKEGRMYPIPVPVINVAARFMEIRANLTGKPPLLTPSWVKKYTQNWELSSEKARQELGYTITPVEKGLDKTVSWILKNRSRK